MYDIICESFTIYAIHKIIYPLFELVFFSHLYFNDKKIDLCIYSHITYYMSNRLIEINIVIYSLFYSEFFRNK